MAADGIPVPEVVAGELLVHDGDLGGSGGVLFGEVAAGVERDLESGEEAG